MLVFIKDVYMYFLWKMPKCLYFALLNAEFKKGGLNKYQINAESTKISNAKSYNRYVEMHYAAKKRRGK